MSNYWGINENIGPGSRGGVHSYSELLTAEIELDIKDFRQVMKRADNSITALSDKKKPTDVFEKAGDNLIVSAVDAIDRFSTKIMTESLIECPEDTGVLKRSARVLPPVRRGQRFIQTIGYGYGNEVNPKSDMRVAAQYAVPVHEIYYHEHIPPTKSHFLVDPVIFEARKMQVDMAIWIREFQAGKVKYINVNLAGDQLMYHIQYMTVPVSMPALSVGVRVGGSNRASRAAGAIPLEWGPIRSGK